MDHAQLETFVVLCETGSLTRTAELLFITQPSVSARINLLEEELGYRLVNRRKGRKQVEITARGEEFRREAQRLVRLFAEIESSKQELSNSLRISSIASLSTPLVSEICLAMRRLHGTRIDLLTYQTEEAYAMVASHDLDAAFVSSARTVSGVNCEPVFRQEYVAARIPAGAGGSAAGASSILSSDLDPAKEIYQYWNESYRLWHDQKFGVGRYLIRVDSCELLRDFMTEPGSWTILQESNLANLRRDLDIEELRLVDGPPPRVSYLLTPAFPDRNNLRVLREFRRLCGVTDAAEPLP